MMLQKCGETLQNKLSCGNFQEGKFQIKHKKRFMLTFPGRTTNEETEGQGYCNKGAIKTRISKQSQFQFQFVARYKKLLA